MARTKKTAPADGAKKHKGWSRRASGVPVADGMSANTNRVYLIPPNRDMAILPGSLHLIEPLPPRGQPAAIDPFFRSLRRNRRQRVAGTGQTAALRDVGDDPAHAVWRNEAGHVGYQAARALPRADDRPPVFTRHAAKPDAFDRREVALLEELARYATEVRPAPRTGASTRKAIHRTDPAETLPGPDGRREGSP